MPRRVTRRVGLEADHVTWSGAAGLGGAAPGGRAGADERRWSRRLRVVKDPGELARMERAAAIADAALGEVLPLLAEAARPGGRSPRPASQPPSTTPCARRAPRSAPSRPSSPPARTRPSRTPARPTDAIRAGDPVVVDFGAVFDGLPLGHDPDLLRRRRAGRRAGPGLRGGGRRPSAPGSPSVTAGHRGRRGRRGVPRRDRGGGLGRALRARDRSRRRPRHPRGAVGGSGVDCYPRTRHRGHRGARCLPSRDRRGPHRGHPGGHRGRLPAAHHVPEGSRV